MHVSAKSSRRHKFLFKSAFKKQQTLLKTRSGFSVFRDFKEDGLGNCFFCCCCLYISRHSEKEDHCCLLETTRRQSNRLAPIFRSTRFTLNAAQMAHVMDSQSFDSLHCHVFFFVFALCHAGLCQRQGVLDPRKTMASLSHISDPWKSQNVLHASARVRMCHKLYQTRFPDGISTALVTSLVPTVRQHALWFGLANLVSCVTSSRLN